MKLYIDKQADRDAVAVVLVRNGYTVRQDRTKEGTKYVWFLEVEK